MNLNDTPSLGALTAADFPAHCAGPCNQGRALCPCPVACGLIDAEDAQRGEPRNTLPLHRYVAELLRDLLGTWRWLQR